MASIRKDIPVAAPAAEVWDAVRDFGAVHQRVAPGFVIDARLDGEARIVTFANGTVARELLVDCDDARLRLVYAIVSERVTHYNGAIEIVPGDDARCRIVWTIDVLPNEIAGYIDSQMDLGVSAMQKAFHTAKPM
jgi:hypothetical protein